MNSENEKKKKKIMFWNVIIILWDFNFIIS